MELKKTCVSTTPEEMWQELQAEKKLRNQGFDLNNLPESNVSEHPAITLKLNYPTSVYERILAQGICLLEDELLRALHHSRAKTILKKHLNLCQKLGYRYGFYRRVQKSLLLSSWGREFLYDCIKNDHCYFVNLDSDVIYLLRERQMDFFAVAEPQKIFYNHCMNGWKLFEQTLLELVKYPFAPEILLLYLQNTKEDLSSAVLLKICKQPYASLVLTEYAKFGYDIDYEVQEKISKLACAKEFFTAYAATDADVNMNIYYNLR